MSTRAAKRASTFTINPRRIVAVVAQVGSYATTYLFFKAIGMEGWLLIGVSLLAEALLLAGKHIVLSGENRSDGFGWASIVIDTLFNGGGMWPYLHKADKTPSWTMLAEGLNLGKDMHNLPALVIALVLGFLLAVAPHWIWREH